MRSTNRKRSLLVSSAVILLCMTVVVGSTWALFTDTNPVHNHLIAGDLDIKLERTDLVKNTLDAQGFLKETTIQSSAKHQAVDFSNENDENVFGIEDDELVVPGSQFRATMKITNNSDVAFGYWVKIICTDKTTGKDMAAALADQLIVKIYTDKNNDGTIDMDTEFDTDSVSDNLMVGSDQNFISVLGKSTDNTLENYHANSEKFIVEVTFKDNGYTVDTNGELVTEAYDSAVTDYVDKDNNFAMKDEVKFDLVVYAVQVKTNPATTTTAPTP